MPSSSGAKGRVKLLEFHRPPFDLNKASIPHLTLESRRCIQNLAAYRAPKWPFRYPKSRTSAVLVALFVGRMGDIYVLLSRRASQLRTYAGDTVLPGGKWEPRDKSYEWTARREAFEEVGLPLDYTKVPLLCVLEPVLTMNSLIVIPVVVLILDNTVQPVLNQAEVAALFSHPLNGFLRDSDPPFPLATEPEMLEMKYHTFVDYNSNTIPGKLRTHYFLTGREAGGTKPIFGLTATMLISVASIGYGREPDFEASAPDQPGMEQRIAYALRHDPVFRVAAAAEGIDPDRTPDPASLPRRSQRRADVKGSGRRGAFRAKL
ncbi:NUDIX hydrolase domain-like protein [Ganoderma leucocontextum]|nr:NUDIX hydrolase domain-like protein [Ganoderma leucocontextum]